MLIGILSGAVRAQVEAPIRIGYVLPHSGESSAGAGITTLPNYQLWINEVNAQGGIRLPDGSRRLIALVEYDSRSDSRELKAAIERLAVEDEVDFLLAPWGTGANLAVAPLFDRFGYPQLAVTAVTDEAPELVSRWSRSFWLLGGGKDYMLALVTLLAEARDANTINPRIAMVAVADGFGNGLAAAARSAFTRQGFDVVYDRTYPLGTTDFVPILSAAQASGADTFIALSYPAGTFAMTRQAQSVRFNPKVFYTGVGAGFPLFPQIGNGNIEGVMSLGGIDPGSEAIKGYFSRHTELQGVSPDSWASVVTYASLEMLQQAIERHGLDREAVSHELSTGHFTTVLGDVKLKNNRLRDLWLVGQWQGDHFTAIAPADRSGTAAARIPKTPWR